MSSRLCFAGQVILPDALLAHGYVLVEDGHILAITTTAPTGLPCTAAPFISPGFLDIHVHGGAGADYMDGTPAAVRTANLAHLRHGATTVLPTTTTGSPAELAAMLHACRAVAAQWTPSDGARLPGIHFYGPYFAPTKVGCHSPAGQRSPDAAEYEAFLATGFLRVATCAAELPGALAFYQAAAAHGCLVTCGHSNATWTQMAAAFAAGMRHVDHFWCAMSSVASLRATYGTPMQASMEQFVLATPDMSTEVIADGQHLSPELLRFAWQMLGSRRLCLVTDANRALDMPPGRYRFGHHTTGSWFESNGEVGFVPGQGLASSVRGLDHMVRQMVAAGVPVVDAIRMASLTPAERTGLAHDRGSLTPGKLADILLLNDDLTLRSVYLAGNLVHW